MDLTSIPQEVDPRTGLPIGPLLARPEPARPVTTAQLVGSYCRLERLDIARHGDDLFAASNPPDAAERFLYLFTEPPATQAGFYAWMTASVASVDPLYFAVVDQTTGRTVGRQSYLRIDPRQQSIEIGDIYWGPKMSRTRLATEALFLFVQHAFDDLGYRRFEWKCNALNAPSCRAAVRFGFTYEGLFRRAAIVKGRTRDTAWFSIIDEEWPQIKAGYIAWLAADNFDGEGRQRQTLTETLTQHRPSEAST
jgi:RimJ/RimL family protein N-acetyltransferase